MSHLPPKWTRQGAYKKAAKNSLHLLFQANLFPLLSLSFLSLFPPIANEMMKRTMGRKACKTMKHSVYYMLFCRTNIIVKELNFKPVCVYVPTSPCKAFVCVSHFLFFFFCCLPFRYVFTFHWFLSSSSLAPSPCSPLSLQTLMAINQVIGPRKVFRFSSFWASQFSILSPSPPSFPPSVTISFLIMLTQSSFSGHIIYIFPPYWILRRIIFILLTPSDLDPFTLWYMFSHYCLWEGELMKDFTQYIWSIKSL